MHPGQCVLRFLAASAAFLLCSAQAAMYLDEGFNYQPGVLGTNTPWAGPSGLFTVTENLSYPSLKEIAPGSMAVNVAPGTTAVTYRPLTSTASTDSVYVSFLLKFTTTPGNYYIAGLLPSTVGLPNGSASDPCDLIVSSAAGGYSLGIRAKGQTAAYAPSVLSLNTAYLIVMKYEFTPGTASLYLDVPVCGTETVADVSSTGSKVSNLNHVYLRAAAPTAGNFLMGSLRVGSTWAEVTPAGNIPPAARLVFASVPAVGTTGAILPTVKVQFQSENGLNAPTNNVPIAIALSSGSFAAGTTTAASDSCGGAEFDGLVIDQPGDYTIVASVGGIGAGVQPVTSQLLRIGSGSTITEKGMALSAFLDSLEVERYWANGVSVNWLTGAAGGAGTNMTKGAASHCSAFAAAVAKVLGVYLLRPWDASDLGLANNQADWLLTNNAGWYPISSMIQAQQQANSGRLVVASLKETNGTSGHIAIVRPSTKSDAEILAQGPQECQSGIYNYNNTTVSIGFNQHEDTLNRILYYGHDITNSITPANPVFAHGTVANTAFVTELTTVVGRIYALQTSADLVAWGNARVWTNSNAGLDFYQTGKLTNSSGGQPWNFHRVLAK